MNHTNHTNHVKKNYVKAVSLAYLMYICIYRHIYWQASLHPGHRPRLDVVNVSRDGHVQHQRRVLYEGHVVGHALLEVGKREERSGVGVLPEGGPELRAEGGVGKGEHAAVGLHGQLH